MVELKKNRAFGADLTKVLAVFFVVLLHSYSYRGAQNVDMRSLGWTVMVSLRYLTQACVPIFMVLSGFLLGRRTPEKPGYRGLLPLLFSYFVITVTLTLGMWWKGIGPATLWEGIVRVFNGSIGYGWYVEMYVGLALLAPFLNAAWGALTDAGRRRLLLVLAFLTLLPDTVCSFGRGVVSLDVFPDWWETLYPITYYFCGVWLREYPPRMKRSTRFLCLAGAVLVPTVLNWFYSSTEYAWYMLQTFSNLAIAAIAVLTVACLQGLSAPPRVEKLVAEAAKCSLETYLCSYAYDMLLYDRLPFGQIPMAVIVFLCAVTSAWAFRFCAGPILKRLGGQTK